MLGQQKYHSNSYIIWCNSLFRPLIFEIIVYQLITKLHSNVNFESLIKGEINRTEQIKKLKAKFVQKYNHTQSVQLTCVSFTIELQ